MNSQFIKSIILAVIMMICIAVPSGAAEMTAPWPEKAVSLGAEFSSGSYGTDSTIRSFYLPLVLTWLPSDRLDLSIEIPYIYQNSSAVTTDLYRSGQSTSGAVAAGAGGPGGNRGGGTTQQQIPGTITPSGTTTSSVSGLGDIVLRLGFISLFEGEKMPQLRHSLFLKTPTASNGNGLGTGEYDGGVGIDAAKWFGNLHLSGEGLYTWQGRVESFGLKDYASLTGAAGYQLTEKLRPMVVIKGATPPSRYSGHLLEGRVRLLYSLSPLTSFDFYLSRGIAASSPDYGGGLTVTYAF